MRGCWFFIDHHAVVVFLAIILALAVVVVQAQQQQPRPHHHHRPQPYARPRHGHHHHQSGTAYGQPANQNHNHNILVKNRAQEDHEHFTAGGGDWTNKESCQYLEFEEEEEHHDDDNGFMIESSDDYHRYEDDANDDHGSDEEEFDPKEEEEDAPHQEDHQAPLPLWMELWKNDKDTLNQALQVLFPNPKPRGIFHSVYKASKSTALGFLVGMSSLAATLPLSILSLALSGGYWQLSIGVGASGIALGLVSIGLGIGNALLQCAWGLCQWPRSLEASCWHMTTDRAWNPKTGQYVLFDLDRYQDELQGNANERRGRLLELFHGGKPQKYYHLLGVPTSFTKQELKRAYYRKALQVHPDKINNKNSNCKGSHQQEKEDAAQRFDQVHKAYRTLAEDSRRALYDEWGDLVENHGVEVGSPAPFDPYIFASTLFQSKALEPYVGRLFLTTLVEQVFYLLLFAEQEQQQANHHDDAGDETGLHARQYYRQTVRRVIESVASWSLRSELRETKVAIHLRSCMDPFISGDMSEEDFRRWCKEEAHRLICSTTSTTATNMQVDPTLLDTLGEALIGTTCQFRGFHWLAPWSWSWGVLAWGRNTFAKTRHKLRMLGNLFGLLKESAGVAQPSSSADDQDEDENIDDEEEQFNTMMSRLVCLADSYNHLDIWKLVEATSWKLVRDSSVSRRVRFARARGLRILGEEIREVVAHSCGMSEEGRRTPVKDRLDQAWYVATTGVRRS